MSVTRNCCVGVFSVVSIHQHDQAAFRPHHSLESLVWNKASVHYKPSMAGCYENLMRGLMAILTQIRGGNVWIMNTALHHWHHFRWQISWRDQSVQSLTSSFRHHHAMSNIIRMIETDQVIMTVWGIINVSTERMFVVLCCVIPPSCLPMSHVPGAYCIPGYLTQACYRATLIMTRVRVRLKPHLWVDLINTLTTPPSNAVKRTLSLDDPLQLELA